MLLNEDNNPGLYKIKNYTPGQFLINDEIITHSVLITAKMLQNWPPHNLAELTDEHWDTVINYAPQILIFGVGSKFVFPDMQKIARLYQNKISFEVMDTYAACRTLAILMAEHRDVAGALLVD